MRILTPEVWQTCVLINIHLTSHGVNSQSTQQWRMLSSLENIALLEALAMLVVPITPILQVFPCTFFHEKNLFEGSGPISSEDTSFTFLQRLIQRCVRCTSNPAATHVWAWLSFSLMFQLKREHLKKGFLSEVLYPQLMLPSCWAAVFLSVI